MASWVKHNGLGRPLPAGTLVDARRFNGEVEARFHIGDLACVTADGTVEANPRNPYSAWDHSDGGPIGVKFRFYRVVTVEAVQERNAVMFQSWLTVREREDA